MAKKRDRQVENSAILATENNSPFLGLIAGNGKFPFYFAQGALLEGKKVKICAIKGETDPSITKLVGEENCHWVSLGHLDELIGFFKNFGITQVVMAGKVTKTRLFRDVQMDSRMKEVVTKLPEKSDDTLLLAIAGELLKEGIHLLDSTLFIKKMLVAPGTLTHQKPSDEELADVKFGFSLAKKMGLLDIGQSVVVKNLSVLAVEAIEGTDECIQRGSRLGNGKAVVVKVAKPDQDMRFDIPVIGIRTIQTLIDSKASVLGLESGKVLVLDQAACVELANSRGLSIISLYQKGEEFHYG